MKLLELHLDGFGRLVDRAFAFSPGFNLIYGPNEAGKSTLQRAILALLYGFFDEGSITAAKRAEVEAWQPWQTNAPFAGRLRYRLEDGQTFEVKRVFAPKPAVSLFALTEDAVPRDVTGQYKNAGQGRLFFAEAQLGLSKTVFENTCTVRQAELVALETSAAAITDALTRLAASASADTNVADALAALDQASKGIGTDRAWTRPLPQARQRLKTLETERTTVQQSRRELFSRIVEQQQVEAQVQGLETEIARWQCLELAAEASALRQRLDVLDAAQTDVAQRAEALAQQQAWATFHVHLRDDVLRLSERRERLQAESAQAQPHAEQAQTTLATLREQIEAMETRVAALEGARSTPVAARSEIQTLAEAWQRAQENHKAAQERWRKAQAQVDQAAQRIAPEHDTLLPALETGQAGLAQAQQQLSNARERAAQTTEVLAQAETEWARTGMSTAQFLALEQTVQEIQSGVRPTPKPRRGCRFWPFGKRNAQPDPTPTELVVYAQLKPLHTALVQAQTESQRANKTLAETEYAIKARLGNLLDAALSAETFAALGERLERYLRAEAGLEQQRATVADLRSELTTAQTAHAQAQNTLQAMLAQHGFATQADYERQCQRHAELALEEAALAQLHLEARACDREINDWQDRQQSLTQAEAELCALLAQANIACTPETMADALATFADAVEHQRRWSELKAAYDAAVKHRDALLEQEDRATLETAWNSAQHRLAEWQQDHPDWTILQADQTASHYRQQRQQAEQRRFSARESITRLHDEIQRTGESLRHPAEIDEEIASVKAEIHRLEQFRDALTLASTELSQANQEFQRQFAPHLETLMREGLSQVTDGRYTQARVDATSLAVSLLAPEREDEIGVERLSTGTRDLVYLMLRMSIARLMSSTAERLPLLLDDPLVQYDRERRERAIAFLLQAAMETQVFFFTKDEEILVQIEQLQEDVASHRIYRLD